MTTKRFNIVQGQEALLNHLESASKSTYARLNIEEDKELVLSGWGFEIHLKINQFGSVEGYILDTSGG